MAAVRCCTSSHFNFLPVSDKVFTAYRRANGAWLRDTNMNHTIALTINGKPYSDEVEPRLLLIHYLREVAGLTGPHIGCETSICGACTVAVDGKAVKSCSMFAVQADGREVLTIEGLASNSHLHYVQEAFWNEHGLQCGFCTPGMIMASKQLLERNPSPIHPEWPDNIAFTYHQEGGEPEKAFADAEVVIKQRITSQRLIPTAMETRGVVADYRAAEKNLTLWSSTQILHLVRTLVAQMLGVGENRMRVITPEVGGGFGSKLNVYAEEALMGFVSMKIGKP